MDEKTLKDEFREMLGIKPKEEPIFQHPKRRTYWKKYQQALLELETLKNTIKDDLYKEFMAKLEEPDKMERIKKENRRLRQQVKELKEMLK